MDIDSSYFNNYLNTVKDDASSRTAEYSKLKNKLDSTGRDTTDEELMDVCKQFEAYLWEQVYKNVDKTTNLFGSQSDGSYAGNMVNMFSDTLIQEVSKMSVGEGDNSLAMQLYEQMKRNYGVGVKTPEEIDAE